MKLTVICTHQNDYPEPLIYVIDFPKDEACAADALIGHGNPTGVAIMDDIRNLVAARRIHDLDLSGSECDGVADEIEVHFCFAGDIPTLIDFRN